ncbi:MAG TPA: hypothetical protein VN817_06925 [Solirubrobacteraceae bacterium]|nr:hypothetical protein [Solirubrobacteraceae bacterium]
MTPPVIVVFEQQPIAVPVVSVKKRRVPIGESIAARRTRATGSAAS